MTTPAAVLSDSPVAAPVCEAPGCGRALSPAQLARGARACSAACRARAHRARREALREANLRESVRRERRTAVLGALDRIGAEVVRLRAEVEHW
jgi:hypothetical protein